MGLFRKKKNPEIRVPVFGEEFLFNVYDDIKATEDVPDHRWIDVQWQPEKWTNTIGERYDEIAHVELARLLKFSTCPYCRTGMIRLDANKQPGIVLACQHCLYWGGRGTRDWGFGPSNARGILGRCRVVENVDELLVFNAIDQLRKENIDMVKMSPFKAEQIIPQVLKHYLDCEVRVIGGVKDDGVDALVIRSNRSKMIVQLKWRTSTKGAEKVSVVREVAGTLLARGVPNGMIISTRSKFSEPAKKEADLISEQYVKGIGRLNLELKDFNDIIDMLDVAHAKLSPNLPIEKIIPFYRADECLFG